MRIALVDSVPLTFGGGYERFLLRVAPRLASAGHDVTVVTPSVSTARPMYWVLSGRALLQVISPADVTHGLGAARLVQGGMRATISALRSANVVYGKNEPHELLFMRLALAGSKSPLVVGVHTAPPPSDDNRDLRARVYSSRAYRLLLKRASAVHVLQADSERLVADQWGVRADLIRRIPNGVDVERFTPSVTGRVSFRVLYVGRLDRHKGADTFYAAVERVLDAASDVVVTIAGDGPLRTDAEALAARSDRVTFLGYVDDVSALYRAHELVVAPSRRETNALVPAEAMASGVPVIVTDIPASNDYVEGGAVGVRPNNPAAVAEAILRLRDEWSTCPDAYEQRRRSACDFARSRLDVRNVDEALLRFLEEIA